MITLCDANTIDSKMSNNKNKLYIHIGTWKTGSTTIQHNLERNKKALKQEGFIYLSDNEKLVIDDGTIRFFKSLEHEYVEQSRDNLKRLLIKYQRENPNCTFISSAEEFSGNAYEGFNNTSAIAKNLYEITKELDLEIKIIVYLRRQDDFIESLYSQSIPVGESYSFDEFLNKFGETHFDWHSLLKSYAAYFGESNILVRKYHKNFLPNKDSLIQDFNSIIKSDVLDNYSITVSKNNGFTREAVEITRITNNYLDDEERSHLRKIFKQINTKKPYEKYSFFKFDDRLKFLNRYSDSNQRVVTEFLGDSVDQLFPQPLADRRFKEYKGLDMEAVIVNFTRALLLVEQEVKLSNQTQFRISKNRHIRYKIQNLISNFRDKYRDFKN